MGIHPSMSSLPIYPEATDSPRSIDLFPERKSEYKYNEMGTETIENQMKKGSFKNKVADTVCFSLKDDIFAEFYQGLQLSQESGLSQSKRRRERLMLGDSRGKHV